MSESELSAHPSYGQQGITSPDAQMCRLCHSRTLLNGTYSCVECLGRVKVTSKVRQLLKEQDIHVTQEEVEARCVDLITGVYKTADNHWQFSIEGLRARRHGIFVAANELKARAFGTFAESNAVGAAHPTADAESSQDEAEDWDSAQRPWMCPSCHTPSVLISTDACHDCHACGKVISKLRQLLQEDEIYISLEDVEAQCRGMITGVYKTADNHWQFSVDGQRARMPGIFAAANHLKHKAFEADSKLTLRTQPSDRRKRKAAWSSTSQSIWLDPSVTDGARRTLTEKSDQVQIAQAHLSCCVKDHEQLQEQLQELQMELAETIQKRAKAERQLAAAQAEEAAAANELQAARERVVQQCKDAKRLLDHQLARAMS